MKKTLLMIAVIGMLSACGGGEKKTEDAAKEGAADEKKEITLKEIKGDKIGFTILIPEGAKELQNTDMNWTYSLVFDAMFEINISVYKEGGVINNIDDAVKATNFMAEIPVKEKKTIGADYLIVKQPKGVLQETWYFAKAKEGFVATKVSAPTVHEATCIKIASSLKAL
jgi:hypothetical protein